MIQFHQSEWLLRICGQDQFWNHAKWATVLNDQLRTLGTRFERLDLQTAGKSTFNAYSGIFPPP